MKCYREFYGNLKSERDIEIKDACEEVFQTMIEFIYNKKPKYKDLDLSFLASASLLPGRQVRHSPENLVTEENVLDIANFAEDNILHQPLSEALYDAAAS